MARLGCTSSHPVSRGRNGCVESFNSRIRDECLNINSFWSLAQARVIISDWKYDDNHHRRHSALGPTPRPLRRHLHPPRDEMKSDREVRQRCWCATAFCVVRR